MKNRLLGIGFASVLTMSVFGDGFPAVVDGVITIDIAAATTYDVALPAATKLVKKGAGEATLTVDTSAFAGTVDVQAGTLKLTTLKAVGSNTKIEVTGDAATLHLYKPARPSGAGQTTKLFSGHDLTIRGVGADGKGAFRYTAIDTKVCDDSLLDALTLSGDANIAIPSRMGVAGPIRLNGHTLTRTIGGGNWMLYQTTTIDAGEIVNQAGTFMVQYVPTFSDVANTRICVTGGDLRFWNTFDQLPCEVVLKGGNLVGDSGSNTPARNRISGRVVVEPLASGATTAASFNTGAGKGLALTGELVLNRNVERTNDGKLFLQGPVSGSKTLYNRGAGWLVATTDVGRVVGSYMDSGATGSKCWLGGGTLFTSAMLRLGNGGGRSTFYQTGGAYRNNPNDTGYIGEHTGTYGCWYMTGGETHFSNGVQVAKHRTSQGLVFQKGGLFEMARDGCLSLGGGSRAEMYVAGGTNDTRMLSTGGTTRFNMSGAGGVANLTVTGAGTLFKTDALQIGCATNASTNVVNLANGATMEIRRFFRLANTPAGTKIDMNVDGGILKPTFYSGWAHQDANHADFYRRVPDHITVHAGGIVLDTSDLRANTVDGPVVGAAVLPHHFDAPAGKRIASISLPTDAAFTALKYFGPALIDIEGPEGSYGASAFADFDFMTEKLANVVITGPGCNYDETTKVYVHAPGNLSTRYLCTYTLADNPKGGPLVKRGPQQVNLHAPNTYAGGTVVEEGTLCQSGAGAIPADAPVTVKQGATLELNGRPLAVSALAGAGTVAGTTITVNDAGEFRITAAELFAEGERTAQDHGRAGAGRGHEGRGG